MGFVEFYQGSKFRFLILYVKLIVFENYLSMWSRNRDICQSNLTLMTSSDFYGRVLLGWDQMKASFIFSYFSMNSIKALKNDIRFDRLNNGHHLNFFWIYFDDSRERTFTDLTFEFCEVVGCSDIVNFLLDLTVDPLSEACNVDFRQTSFTKAWRNQRITIKLFAAKTDFTSHLMSIIFFRFFLTSDCLKNSISIVKVISVPNC